MFRSNSILVFGLCIFLSFNCKRTRTNNESGKQETNQKMFNPVVYFEIPVTDMGRAIQFYKNVFAFEFEKDIIDHNEMALFPFSAQHTGISGALAKGATYQPTNNGVIIYFKTINIDHTLKLVGANGGKILYPKTSIGDLGFVAEFEDSEGNRVALHQSN